MINGFEDETGILTTEEMSAIPFFQKGFEDKIGEGKAVTNGKIRHGLSKQGFNLTDARIRKIINYIRLKKIVVNLVASSAGYYIENDKEKLKKYQQSLIQRAKAIQAVADSYN